MSVTMQAQLPQFNYRDLNNMANNIKFNRPGTFARGSNGMVDVSDEATNHLATILGEQASEREKHSLESNDNLSSGSSFHGFGVNPVSNTNIAIPFAKV